MLYSAAGVTFPTVVAAPPIMTIFFNFKNVSGCSFINLAAFVSGPKVTRVISFGNSEINECKTSI